MVITAIALADDARRQARRVDRPEHPQRQHHRVRRQLGRGLQATRRRAHPHRRSSPRSPRPPALPGVTTPSLPDLGVAPAFVGTERWFNTPGDQPLSIRGLRGRVVLIDFWTYTCINCIRTLPYLEAWDAKYRSKGLTDRRHRGARVPVRARRRQRRERDSAVRHPLPRRPGQQSRHLERLGKPVLARRLPDRRHRSRPLRDLRRGRLHHDRGRDPSAARPGRRQAPRRRSAGPRGDRAVDAWRRPRPTSERPARRAGSAASRCSARTSTSRRATPWRVNDFAYGGTWSIGNQQALAGPGATIEARRGGQERLHRALASQPRQRSRQRVSRRSAHADARRHAAAPVYGGVVRERLDAHDQPALLAGDERLLVHLRLRLVRAASPAAGAEQDGDASAGRGRQSSTNATTRAKPALARRILTGKAATLKPCERPICSRWASFSI